MNNPLVEWATSQGIETPGALRDTMILRCIAGTPTVDSVANHWKGALPSNHALAAYATLMGMEMGVLYRSWQSWQEEYGK